MPSFWDDIFGQLNQPPLVLDERVNPPTPPEHQGLEGSMVANMWNDPVALAGYRRGIVNWNATTSDPSYMGEYWSGGPLNDTINFTQGGPVAMQSLAGYQTSGPMSRIGQPAMSRPDPTNMTPVGYLPRATSDPNFTNIGTHEFRHRGFNTLPAAARAYGIPFRDTPARMSEELNVYQDRQLNDPTSYQGQIEFTPQETQFYAALLERMRGTADQVNAARVRWLQAHPGRTWSDAP